MANSIMVIHPYKYEGMWVFDDDNAGLVKEPFIAGADDIIEKMVTDIPNAYDGFSLVFASIPFPGFQIEFEWRREDAGGNWYYTKALNMEGWLCPALFQYFEEAPKYIYAQFKTKSA